MQCDICGCVLNDTRTTPRLKKKGDIEPSVSAGCVAIGSGAIAFGTTPDYQDPVASDADNLAKHRPPGTVPGYPLTMRADCRLVQIWVTWREAEDVCELCVKKAIRKKADQIEREDPLGCLADLEE